MNYKNKQQIKTVKHNDNNNYRQNTAIKQQQISNKSTNSLVIIYNWDFYKYTIKINSFFY